MVKVLLWIKVPDKSCLTAVCIVKVLLKFSFSVLYAFQDWLLAWPT